MVHYLRQFSEVVKEIDLFWCYLYYLHHILYKFSSILKRNIGTASSKGAISDEFSAQPSI